MDINQIFKKPLEDLGDLKRGLLFFFAKFTMAIMRE